MSRSRRGTQQVWYDTFMDWTLEDQSAAMRMLEELHRQKRRMTAPQAKEHEDGDKPATAE